MCKSSTVCAQFVSWKNYCHKLKLGQMPSSYSKDYYYYYYYYYYYNLLKAF